MIQEQFPHLVEQFGHLYTQHYFKKRDHLSTQRYFKNAMIIFTQRYFQNAIVLQRNANWNRDGTKSQHYTNKKKLHEFLIKKIAIYMKSQR